MSAIRKTLLNSVAAANHLCTILHTVANLPFYTVLRAALCIVNLYWVWGAYFLGVRWLLGHLVHIYIYIYHMSVTLGFSYALVDVRFLLPWLIGCSITLQITSIGGCGIGIVFSLNRSAWGYLKPSQYCDVGRFFYGVFKFWAKLYRSLFKIL